MVSGNSNSCVKTGPSSGEGLISEVRDPVEDGAKVIDPGVEDKRLLVLEAEFAVR